MLSLVAYLALALLPGPRLEAEVLLDLNLRHLVRLQILARVLAYLVRLYPVV